MVGHNLLTVCNDELKLVWSTKAHFDQDIDMEFIKTGWNLLSSSNESWAVQLRSQLEEWLNEIPPKHDEYKNDVGARLHSSNDDQSSGARPELAVHNLLRRKGFMCQPHPPMAKVGTKPDFLVQSPSHSFYVECLTINYPNVVLRQSHELRNLEQSLSNTNWKYPFSIHADTDLPSGFPHSQIKEWLQDEQQKIEVEQLERPTGYYLKIQSEVIQFAQEGFPITYQGKHLGTDYAITFTVFPPDSCSADRRILRPELLPPISCVVENTRDKIADKSRKYGNPDRPFVIAVWCRMSIYGLNPSNILSGFPGHKNGLFMKVIEDKFRYSRVSAVIFYNYGHNSTENVHGFEVYHNPDAARHLSRSIFAGHDQWEYFENAKGYGWGTV